MITTYDDLLSIDDVSYINHILTYEHPWYFSNDITSEYNSNKGNLSLGTIRHREDFFDFDNYLMKVLSDRFDTSKIFRCFSNCFRKGDRTNFHVDPGGKTYMFYLNKDWKRRWGSHTIFRRNGMVKVLPKPGRLVVFDASIEHKGTPPTFLFPNSIAGRFSIAFHER